MKLHQLTRASSHRRLSPSAPESGPAGFGEAQPEGDDDCTHATTLDGPAARTRTVSTDERLTDKQCGRRIPLIAVEAIIGAGKSTLLETIKNAYSASGELLVVQEPVETWMNVNAAGENLLEMYYGDQKRWAFSFQTFAMFSRIEALRQVEATATDATRAIVIERSWLSDRHCFAAMLKDDGNLSAVEEAMHAQLFRETKWPKIDGVVYLDVDVANAQKRVAARGRSEESEIPTDYQERLSKKHEEWVTKLEGDANESVGVLRLDANKIKSAEMNDLWMRDLGCFVTQLEEQKSRER